MKRYLLAVAAVVFAAMGSARADWGSAPVPPGGPAYGPLGYAPQPGPAPEGQDRYGWNPIIRKVLWWKKDGGSCKSCSNCNMTPPPYGVYGNPNGMPGTLVFPNHQFIRSPRDYFMWER